jgi:hypothetical protein
MEHLPMALVAERRPDPAAHAPLLYWLIFTGASVFGGVLLWHFGLVRQMVLSDRTYISSVIVLLYLATSLHCLWRTTIVAREGDAARRALRLAEMSGDLGSTAHGDPAGGAVAGFLRDLAARRTGSDATPALRRLAARLRAPNQLGGFAADILMKLGLVGTIIGFIMMLAPIAGLDAGDRGSIKSSMTVMSDGMAVAMYTTLAGLVSSILVTIQYYLLEDATAKVFTVAAGLAERPIGGRAESTG